MTPEELINISLEDEVEIEPNTTIPAMKLITCKFEEAKPLGIYRYPFYIALHLQNSNYCKIRMPKYLSKEFLEDLIDKEERSINFVEVPEFIFEHAYFFMNDTIEPLIGKLKQLRLNKIWKGLKELDGKALFINGLTRWEFNEVKPMITEAMVIGKKIITKEK